MEPLRRLLRRRRATSYPRAAPAAESYEAGTPDDPYRDPKHFRWEILGNCVEGARFWDVVHEVARHFPDLTGAERTRFAQETVRALLSADHVYLCRLGRHEGDERRLSTDEVEDVLNATDWPILRSGRDGSDVEVTATDAGRRAFADPPDDIRALWNWPPRPWAPPIDR
jgi:hypothetical protein